MDLSTVHHGVTTRKKKKRVGRGIGSGHGKTAARGSKGQYANAGAKRPTQLFEGGQSPLFRRIPKRGFSHKTWDKEYAIVNVEDLNIFSDGTVIDPCVLKRSGLAKGNVDGVRILGNGDLRKKLIVQAHHFSNAARQKIEAVGGQPLLIQAPQKPQRNKMRAPKVMLGLERPKHTSLSSREIANCIYTLLPELMSVHAALGRSAISTHIRSVWSRIWARLVASPITAASIQKILLQPDDHLAMLAKSSGTVRRLEDIRVFRGVDSQRSTPTQHVLHLRFIADVEKILRNDPPVANSLNAHLQSLLTSQPQLRRILEMEGGIVGQRSEPMGDQFPDRIGGKIADLASFSFPNLKPSLILAMWFDGQSPEVDFNQYELVFQKDHRLYVALTDVGSAIPEVIQDDVTLPSYLEVILTSSSERILPAVNRLPLPAKSDYAAWFEICPQELRPFDICLKLLVRNEPIFKITRTLQVLAQRQK